MARKPTAQKSRAKKKIGRPLKVTAELLEKARALMAPPRCLSVEDAAAELGVGKSQLYAGLKAAPVASSAPSAPSVAKVAPATTELPQGGRVDDRPDLLALVRRILGARDPAALAELEDGLHVFTASGEEALAPWLARPLPRTERVDPLEAAAAALAAAAAHVDAIPPLHPRAATILGAAASLAARVEAISKGRPNEPTPDEVTRRLLEVRDVAVKRIGILTSEAAAKLARDRAELAAWCATLGPMGGEVQRRVDALFGGPAS